MATQLRPAIWHKGPLSACNDMVTLDGVPLPLFPRAMTICALLISHDFVPLATLMPMVKSRESLRVHMSSIRPFLPNGMKLENDEGKGYRLTFSPGG